MRVAVVNSSSQLGGADLSLLPVLEALAERADVVLLTPGPGPLLEPAERAGARVEPGFELPARLRRASRQYARGRLAALPPAAAQQTRLARSLRRMRPDVVYCNGFRAQLGATLPARAAGARVVWHLRDVVPPGALALAWSLLARSTSLVVSSSAFAAAQPALAPVRDRVTIVPNGVDLASFRPREGEPATLVLGLAAHLTPWKGHLRFLRLLDAVRRTIPDAGAAIAGGDLYDTAAHGEYADEVRHGAAARDVPLEEVPPDRMPGWLAGLTVLVHCPDRPEPFGRVLVEAMASGVPVLVSARGGPNEVVGDAAVLVPPDDDDALLAETLRLLDDPETRRELARRGVERAARYDVRETAPRVAEQVLAAGG